MPRLLHFVACIALAIAPTAALAQDAATPPPSPAAAIEKALAAEPDDAVLAFFLGFVRARAGDVDGALDALDIALRNGRGLLPSDAQFPALAADPRFARSKARFARRLERRTDAKVAFTLRDRLLVPEGLAYDPVARAFYVGSIARRSIHRIARDGSLVALSRPQDDLDEVLGLAIDARTRTLYAVSTNGFTAAGRLQRRNAIKAYDLASGRLVRSYDVPDARQLNDVAIAADTLFVSDSEGGGVWRIDRRSGDVRAVVALGSARGANGIAIAPGGDVLYVAANRRPLRVDLSSGAVEPLRLPRRENAAAIDGLYWHDGALIGIQNFTTPARVVRLVLSPDGRAVVSLETLQSHHQRAFVEPTTGAVAPNGFYVLARTYVTRYSERRTLDRPESIRAPIVLRIPLPRG